MIVLKKMVADLHIKIVKAQICLIQYTIKLFLLIPVYPFLCD